jgi:hypothetical protein
MSKNITETEGPQITLCRIRVACWINKAIHTYAHAHAHAPVYPYAGTRKHAHIDQYVILVAFPQQQWFRERASLLRYTYIVCLVKHIIIRILIHSSFCVLNVTLPACRTNSAEAACTTQKLEQALPVSHYRPMRNPVLNCRNPCSPNFSVIRGNVRPIHLEISKFNAFTTVFSFCSMYVFDWYTERRHVYRNVSKRSVENPTWTTCTDFLPTKETVFVAMSFTMAWESKHFEAVHRTLLGVLLLPFQSVNDKSITLQYPTYVYVTSDREWPHADLWNKNFQSWTTYTRARTQAGDREH